MTMLCNECKNRKMDRRKGFICGLIGDKPANVTSCVSFERDDAAAYAQDEIKKRIAAQEKSEMEKKQTKKGVRTLFGIVALIVSLIYMGYRGYELYRRASNDIGPGYFSYHDLGVSLPGDKVINSFRENVRQINRMAPVPTPDGAITGAEMRGKEMVLKIKLSDLYSDMIANGLRLDPKILALAIVDSYISDDDYSIEDVKSSGLSFMYEYYDSDGDPLSSVLISNDDIIDVYDRINAGPDAVRPLHDKQFYVDYQVAAIKPALPINEGGGVVIEAAYGEGSDIVIKSTLKGDIYESATIAKEAQAELRKSMVEDLKQDYIKNKIIYEDMAIHKIRFRYLYKSEKGRVLFSIIIPASEIVD